MVVSDHGGGALHGVVNLNAWLAQEGFLAYGEPRGSTQYRLFELRRRLPQGLREPGGSCLPGLREAPAEPPPQLEQPVARAVSQRPRGPRCARNPSCASQALRLTTPPERAAAVVGDDEHVPVAHALEQRASEAVEDPVDLGDAAVAAPLLPARASRGWWTWSAAMKTTKRSSGS